MPVSYGFLSSPEPLPEDISNNMTLEYFMRDSDFVRVIENRTDGTIRFRKGNRLCECRADKSSALKEAKSFGISLEEGKHLDVMVRFLSELEPGSAIMFSTVTDLSANTEAALYLYRRMDKEGINLRFIKEPWINNELYKSARRECGEIDSVIQSVFRATYESIDYQNSYIALLCRSESNEAKKNGQKKLSEQN